MDALARLDDEIAATGGRRPVLVGIAGAVAVGKSTLAASLRERLVAAGRGVEVVGTDAFLLPNHVLERRALTMRKGFPESYDSDAMTAFAREVRAGGGRATVPVYSHATYDIVPDATRQVDADDVVIVEGVNALQPPLLDALDVAVYIDADEEDVARWFVDRFLALCRAARDDETSFYRGFAAMSDADQRAVAEWTWREINLVNLHDHIAPSRASATVAFTKHADHSLTGSVSGGLE